METTFDPGSVGTIIVLVIVFWLFSLFTGGGFNPFSFLG